MVKPTWITAVLLICAIKNTLQHCEDQKLTKHLEGSNSTCEPSRYDEYDYYIPEKLCENRSQDEQVFWEITCYNEIPNNFINKIGNYSESYPITLIFKNASLHSLTTPISIKPNWKLTKVELTDLQISYLGGGIFSNMTNLEDIRMEGNKLTEVVEGVFSSISSLKYLNLSTNRIQILSQRAFFGSANLSILDLSHNDISFLPENVFDYQNKLKVLDLSYNTLKGNIDFKIFPLIKLKSLLLSNNLITSLKKSDNGILSTDLEILDLSHNSLSQISFTFANLTKLEFVHLQHNNLSNLPASTFNDMKSLKHLDLSHNHLAHLQYGLLSHISKLKYLDISYNDLNLEIQTLFGLSELRDLRFAHNHVKKPEAETILKNFPRLETISLENKFWTCKELLEIVHALQNRGFPHPYYHYYRGYGSSKINVMKGNSYDTENVYGIACNSNANIPNSKEENTTDLSQNKLIKYLDVNFTNTNFYKYLENLTASQNKQTSLATDSLTNNLKNGFTNTSFYKLLEKINSMDNISVRLNDDSSENGTNVFVVISCIILLFILCLLIYQLLMVKKGLNRLSRDQVELSNSFLYSKL